MSRDLALQNAHRSKAGFVFQIALRWLGVFLWMGAIFTLSALPSLATPLGGTYDFTFKKIAHVAEYGILATLLFYALQMHIERKSAAAFITALVAVLFAFSDEWHQTFVPGREGSLRDVGIDALAVFGVSLWFGFAKEAPGR